MGGCLSAIPFPSLPFSTSMSSGCGRVSCAILTTFPNRRRICGGGGGGV